MFQLKGLNDDAYQQYVIPWQGNNIILRLRFVQTVASWFVDCEYKGKKYGSECCVLGSYLFDGSTLPFKIFMIDTTGADLDPFEKSDFLNRIQVYFLEINETAKVPV